MRRVVIFDQVKNFEVLRVRDTHEIDFTHFTEVVDWWFFLAPKGIGFFLY